MRLFAATIMASCLIMVAAVPAATGNAACVPTSPPSTSSCTTTILTVPATAVAVTALSQTPAVTAASAIRNNGTTGTGNNVQKFTGALGGPPPPVVSSAGERPFSVNGDTFVGVSGALGRSCDVQHNACADAANSGEISASVQQCDQQNTACHSANNLKKRLSLDARRPSSPFLAKRAALDLGSCSDANIVFGEGIDGRNTAAFIAANQQDFDHGSALNIAVVAGFICQRLDSPCNAPSDTQASCAQASTAAVAATQDQTAADTWNAIMGDGTPGSNSGASGPTAASAPVAAVTPAPTLEAVPSPVAGVQLLTFSSCS